MVVFFANGADAEGAAPRTLLPRRLHGVVFGVSIVAASGLLYLVSRYNYLLFHSLVELAAIMTSALFFTVAVIMFRRAGHDFLVLLATGFFWSAVIDLVHTLAYTGMGVFPGYGTNLPAQLWVLARYLESLVILTAVIWLGRRLKDWWIASLVIGAVAAAGIAVIFLGWFPTAYVEGSGLTQFKIVSEYIIVGILICSLLIMTSKRQSLSGWTFGWLTGAITLTIFAEVCFTRYVGAYGFFNALGHIFKFMAYASMFRLVVSNMLERPLRVFEAVVPVCAGCKAVRVAEDTWVMVEEFLSEESGKLVTHGLCPKCYQKVLEESGLADKS